MKLRGLRLESHKSGPLERPIRVVPPPATLVLALDQGSGEDAVSVARPGDAVRVGSAVAAAAGAAAAVHSPVSGTVREIAVRPTPRGAGRCIVMQVDAGVPLLGFGQPCQADAQCESGHCLPPGPGNGGLCVELKKVQTGQGI